METLRIPLQDTLTNELVDVGAVLSIDFDKNTQALKVFIYLSC
ncbi:hypothetical protein [Lederbergia citri]|nr:hypothetical protein [Lederbergia citri]